MSLRHAAIAANRFGLGARPGELKQIAPDPRGWLREQIDVASPPSRELASLPSGGQALRDLNRARQRSEGDEKSREAMRRDVRQAFIQEMAQRCLVAARSEQPFRERLVRFWSNHFAVSTTRGEIRSLVGSYEREAIRPHVAARFVQLLMAAERHPAMQIYLDNARSIGPDSMAGRRSGRGLNENHAREILELHTLGVDGGYTQADVEAFAQILTGWGVVRGRGEISGAFTYDPNRHQPGDKLLLGATFTEDGEREGKRALRFLARQPKTARFVATKLARHFISDDPPASAVDALTENFSATEGDLHELYKTLIALPEAWNQTLTKLKTPEELVVSTARGLGYRDAAEPMLQSVRYLGQMPFSAPSPQGWPDQAMGWLGPEAVLTRVEWAQKVGEDAGAKTADPAGLAADLIGPSLSPRTQQAIVSAPNHGEAVALLVASPDFQRR